MYQKDSATQGVHECVKLASQLTKWRWLDADAEHTYCRNRVAHSLPHVQTLLSNLFADEPRMLTLHLTG